MKQKKKLLVYRWGSVCELSLCSALHKLGIEFVEFSKEMRNYHADTDVAEELIAVIHRNRIEGIISYDYFPLISMICEINHIPYLAWIYDCPQYTLLSKTVVNECNYIFCFDRIFCEKIKALDVRNCFHYPLAGSYVMETYEFQKLNSYKCDISFVGNLYNDKKNRLRQESFSEYTAGYIEGIVQAQLLIYGYNFVKEVLPVEVVEEIINKCNLRLGREYIWDEVQLVADSISMEVSARERELVLKTIGEFYTVNLYTGSKLPESFVDTRICNRGYADYQKEVPRIFKNSRINLNITSKTIESGVPQRVFDILCCGGFCLTNYQQEIAEYFEDGKELVMYRDIGDLMQKIEYYLNHEEVRAQIALNGYRKVMDKFKMTDRVNGMLEIAFE